MKKILIALFFGAAVILGSASAQTPRNVIVHSAIFPGGNAGKLELLLADGGNSLPVTPWDGQLSPATELPVLPVWRFGFWKEETGADGKAKRTFVERGRVTPATARRQWLLFFGSQRETEGPLEIKSFAADDSAIQEGGALVLNLTSHLIAGKVSTTEFRVQPNSSTVVNPGTSRGDQYPVAMAYPLDGKPAFFIRSTWFHSERRKIIAMVVQPPASSAPRLYEIVDVTPPPGASREGSE